MLNQIKNCASIMEILKKGQVGLILFNLQNETNNESLNLIINIEINVTWKFANDKSIIFSSKYIHSKNSIYLVNFKLQALLNKNIIAVLGLNL